MADVVSPLLHPPWVRDLSHVLETRLGCRVPPHRMINEIAPFVVAEAAVHEGTVPEVLLDAWRRGGEDEAWRRLVGVATVGETYFFRHPAQVEALATVLARVHARTGRPVRVWCAGCASGEEPFTVAVRLEAAGVPCEITASDVSTTALARARAGGPYSDRSVGHMPEAYRERWLVQERPGAWRVAVRDALPVRIVQHNLAREAVLRPATGAWDAILCRNVLLYFSRATAKEVLERLGGALADWGGLWVSPSDPVDLGGSVLAWERQAEERYLVRADARHAPAAARAPAPARAPASGDDRSPRPWTEELEAWLARGLVVGGRGVVDRRLADRPDDGAAWVARAAFCLHAHEFDQALAALDRARRTHPCPEGLAYLEGIAFLKTGRGDEALVHFLRAVEEDPDDWASSWQAADLYRRQGRTMLEELMLRRTASLLATDRHALPALGPAAGLVNSVHRDPEQTARLARERLAFLEAGHGAREGRIHG